MQLNKLTFHAYGFGAVYTLTMFEDENDVRFLCDCDNGSASNTSFCWHRKKVIKGETNFLANPPPNLDEQVSEYLSKASWLPLMQTLFDKETELEQLEDEIKSLKKQATQAMNGNNTSFF